MDVPDAHIDAIALIRTRFDTAVEIAPEAIGLQPPDLQLLAFGAFAIL